MTVTEQAESLWPGSDLIAAGLVEAKRLLREGDAAGQDVTRLSVGLSDGRQS